MAKIQLFEEWLSVVQKRRGDKWDRNSDVAPFAAYIQHIFAMKQPNPNLYSLEHVKEDLKEYLNDFAEEVGEKMRRPPKPAKNSGKPGAKGGKPNGKDTGEDSDDAKGGGGRGGRNGRGGRGGGGGGGGKGGGAAATGAAAMGASGGKGKRTTGGESEGNEIAVEKKKPDPYNKKAEYGDMELRKHLVRMPKNPDLSMKAEEGDEMEDDRTKWGGVRLSKTMELEPKNWQEFKDAPPGSIWLGFVRVGSRVGQQFEKVTMIMLTADKVTGKNYFFPAGRLKPGDEWHETVLNKLFAETQHGIKVWNGVSEAVMKAKKLQVSDMGCYYGFFLVKASDGGKNHYWNFKCKSLNRWTNGTFVDDAPLMEEKDMNAEQKAAYTNMLTAVRSGFGVPDDTKSFFPKSEFGRRGIRGDSKVLPLSWAMAVIKLIAGGKDDGNGIKERKN